MTMSPEEPKPLGDSFASPKKRGFFPFRRKGDVPFFLLTLGMLAFSFSVLGYKLYWEEPRLKKQENKPAQKTILAARDVKPAKKKEPVRVLSAKKPKPVVRKKEKPKPKIVQKPKKKKKSVKKVKEVKKKAALPHKKIKPAVSKPEMTPLNIYLPLKASAAWKSSADEDAALDVRKISIQGERALEMAYAFSKGQWVEASQKIKANFEELDWLRFSAMGDGWKNTLQFKVEDANHVVHGIKMFNKTNRSDWGTMAVNLGQLRGKGDLDWANIERIYFVISVEEDHNDQGGEGRFWIKDLVIK